MKRWGKRFLSSTRGQVVQLLRRGEATVNELAADLELTDNAVRAHLATLERDGLVRTAGKRPGVRRPEVLYALTADAEQLFPKAYHLLLNRLLAAVERRMPEDELEAMLREVGRELAAGASAAGEETGRRARVVKALGVLESMGGLAELRETDDELVIEGFSCPLAASVREHPAVCRLAEAMLTEIVGVPVREACRREGVPQCVFVIARQDA